MSCHFISDCTVQATLAFIYSAPINIFLRCSPLATKTTVLPRQLLMVSCNQYMFSMSLNFLHCKFQDFLRNKWAIYVYNFDHRKLVNNDFFKVRGLCLRVLVSVLSTSHFQKQASRETFKGSYEHLVMFFISIRIYPFRFQNLPLFIKVSLRGKAYL